MILPLYVRGLFAPYYWVSDCDFVYVGAALIENAGMPQLFFDHPGYPYIQLLRLSIEAAHGLNLVPLSTFSALTQEAQFAPNFGPLVFLGRILALLLALGFLAVFFALARTLTRQVPLAVAATLVLAVSQGVAVHSLIIRPELLASGLVIGAFLLLVKFFQKCDGRTLHYLHGAGILSYTALLTKIQTILPLLVLPFFALFTNLPRPADPEACTDPWFIRKARLARIVLFLGSVPFIGVLGLHLSRDLRGYQVVVAAVVGLWALTARRRFSRRAVISFLAVFGSGLAWGYVLNGPYRAMENDRVILYFADHMKAYSEPFRPLSWVSGTLWRAALRAGAESVMQKLEPSRWVLDPSALWMVVAAAGAVGLLRSSAKKTAGYSLGLIGLALFLESVFRLRRDAPEILSYYRIFVEWPPVLAAALVANEIRGRVQWSRPLRFVLAAGFLGVVSLSWLQNLSRLEKNTFQGVNMRTPPEAYCKFTAQYGNSLRNYLSSLGDCGTVIAAPVSSSH